MALHLKNDHAYYYQYQLELYVTQRLYCDFAIWTEANLLIKCIASNETFLIPQAEKFVCYLNLLRSGMVEAIPVKHHVVLVNFSLKLRKTVEHGVTARNLKVVTCFAVKTKVTASIGFIWNVCRCQRHYTTNGYVLHAMPPSRSERGKAQT